MTKFIIIALILSVVFLPPIRNALLIFMLPLRLPVMLVCYTFAYLNYAIIKILEPRAADVIISGCVNDGLSGNLLSRIKKASNSILKTSQSQGADYAGLYELSLYKQMYLKKDALVRDRVIIRDIEDRIKNHHNLYHPANVHLRNASVNVVDVLNEKIALLKKSRTC